MFPHSSRSSSVNPPKRLDKSWIWVGEKMDTKSSRRKRAAKEKFKAACEKQSGVEGASNTTSSAEVSTFHALQSDLGPPNVDRGQSGRLLPRQRKGEGVTPIANHKGTLSPPTQGEIKGEVTGQKVAKGECTGTLYLRRAAHTPIILAVTAKH